MYEKAHKIQARLKALLSLIQSRSYSASELSSQLGISIATVYRNIEALRQQGYEIKSVRDKDGWHYELNASGSQLEMALKNAVREQSDI